MTAVETKSTESAQSLTFSAQSDLASVPGAGSFAVVLADPPWSYKSYGPQGPKTRAPDRHYRTMSLADLKALPVGTVAARDCHLFLWTTGPHLPQALDLMAAWGFGYSGIAFTWVKVLRRHDATPLFIMPGDWHLGTGYTTRKNTELVLLGRRGSPKRLSASVRELVVAPVREHSRKPVEVHERIEAYAPGPYLELFARAPRPGWSVWGNETEKFAAPAA